MRDLNEELEQRRLIIAHFIGDSKTIKHRVSHTVMQLSSHLELSRKAKILLRSPTSEHIDAANVFRVDAILEDQTKALSNAVKSLNAKNSASEFTGEAYDLLQHTMRQNCIMRQEIDKYIADTEDRNDIMAHKTSVSGLLSVLANEAKNEILSLQEAAAAALKSDSVQGYTD